MEESMQFMNVYNSLKKIISKYENKTYKYQ